MANSRARATRDAGYAAPDLILPTAAGETWSLATVRGQAILLTFLSHAA